jgi:hypothetical protein
MDANAALPTLAKGSILASDQHPIGDVGELGKHVNVGGSGVDYHVLPDQDTSFGEAPFFIANRAQERNCHPAASPASSLRLLTAWH